MGQAGAFVVGFLVVGTAMRALERYAPARSHAPLFACSRLLDVAHWLFAHFVGRLFVNAVTFAALFVFLLVLRIPFDGFDAWIRERSVIGRLPLLVQVPIALVAADFFGYWHHRLVHRTGLFRFHAVHHSSKSLDWLSAGRNHPVAEATVCPRPSWVKCGFRSANESTTLDPSGRPKRTT